MVAIFMRSRNPFEISREDDWVSDFDRKRIDMSMQDLTLPTVDEGREDV
jgi:hypothetical protein